MIAFFADQKIKDFYVDRVKAHQAADEIVKGQYWQNGKGCAVGCSIHGSNHRDYEIELGVPEWLARVEDRIFEGMPDERAKKWPVEFLEAINIGSDLNQIKGPFLIFVLESALEKFNHAKYPKIVKSIRDIQDLWRKYPQGQTDENRREWIVAAADAAAADAAAAAYAAYAAAAAAYAAAAYAAAAAADAAAADAAASYAAARETAYVKFADELLRLIKECKV